MTVAVITETASGQAEHPSEVLECDDGLRLAPLVEGDRARLWNPRRFHGIRMGVWCRSRVLVSNMCSRPGVVVESAMSVEDQRSLEVIEHEITELAAHIQVRVPHGNPRPRRIDADICIPMIDGNPVDYDYVADVLMPSG